MPAKSKAQQRFFGVVKGIQKGGKGTGKAKKAAKDMSPADVDDFASTKHDGLPSRVKREQKVRRLIKKMVGEVFEELNGEISEAKERNYKEEYKKYGSSTKAKKYRAELNAYNRKKGTYGNGDKKDASHKNGKIVGFEAESKNRGRAEKSRLKKEACQKGYKTHPTRKTKIMFGKRYRNCIKAEDIESLSEDRIYSKSDGLKKVKSVSKKGKVYKVDKQKAKYGGKNITMYTLYTKYKNHTTGQNPFGLDMARNSKGEAMYLVPIQEGKLTEKKMDRKKAAIILKQIGGNRFIAMTGAKDFAFSDKYMSFKIGRNSKGINFVRIAHNAMDTYDMEFGFVSIKGIKVKKKVKGVYADMLGTMFKKYTGMNVSL